MLASFVIGFHTQRTDNLLQTLRFLRLWHPEVVRESELVTICQDRTTNMPPEMWAELSQIMWMFKKHVHHDLNLRCMQLPYVTNYGVDRATADKIIILESDRILPKGYFATVIEELRPGLQITTLNMKKLTRPASDEEIEAGVFDYVDEHRSRDNQLGMRNMWSGNTALCREDFYRVGRMDEAYLGYGWADSDMTNTMAKAGVMSLFRDEIELHLWHPPATYGEGDQKQLFINNGLHFCKKWDVPLPDFLRADIAKTKKVLM